MKRNRQTAATLLLLLAFLQIIMLMALRAMPTTHAASTVEAPAASTDQLFPTVDTLVAQADIIVRAQVMSSTSRWNHTHTLIETAHTLAVHYTVLGENTPEITVYTGGGFLATEGLGMRSSHTAAFAPKEEVLVFLQKGADGYQTVNGEIGKFTVFNKAVGSAYFQAQSLAPMISAIQKAAARLGRSTNSLVNWQFYEPTATGPQITRPDQPWVDPKWPGEKPKIRAQVNLNSAHIGEQGGSETQFLAAIKNALRTWSVVDSAEFTLLYNGPSTATNVGFNNKSEILFMNKGTTGQLGQAQIWYTSAGVIVEADLWVNDDYAVDATGAPQANEIDVESVVLHELGHWAPLSHVDQTAAVMYPVLGAGVRKTALASDDMTRLNALYPCPALPCIDPTYADSSTPTQSPDPIISATLTPTPSNTPGSTNTPIPTATTEAVGSNTPSVTPIQTVTPSATVAATATIIPTAATNAAPTTLFLPLITR